MAAPAIFALLLLSISAAVLGPRRGHVRVPPVPSPVTASVGSETQPTLSPDGKQVAYVWRPPAGTWQIYLKALTGEPRRLTNAAEEERSPAWSPKGDQIAFLRRAADRSGGELLLVHPSGGRETRLAMFTRLTQLRWSPDGRWLLALDGPPGGRYLVAISTRDGAKHALTKPTDFGFCGFQLTSDQRSLIYCKAALGPVSIRSQPLNHALQPIGEPRTLISQLSVREMILMPDSKEILYTDGIPEESIGLWRRRLLADANPELILKTSDRYGMPALSQDGKRLVFTVSRSYRHETWKLDLTSTPVKAQPLVTSTHSDLNPDYAPDGQEIAFHSTRSGASDIWITSRDGQRSRRLTHTNAPTTATPRWSPDGRWIAFESNIEGQTEVYRAPRAGGASQRLTTNPALDAIPSWSRDGRYIYFCSNRSGRFEIWRMLANGQQPTQMTFDGGFAAVEAWDGRALFFTQTRDRGPLFRLPLPNGKAEMLIPEVHGLFFALSRKGIYYQHRGRLHFWDAATRASREVYRPDKSMSYGMALSPDEKEVLLAVDEAQDTDLYSIEGF
ncbi:MAG: PD40 domain-containing protein [Bryobacterales bacterium]|nr:PD40 domain-containing protein [Bryobacterales bacterium]